MGRSRQPAMTTMNFRLAPLVLALLAGTASAAPHTPEVCEGLDSAACLERMSAVLAAQDMVAAAPAPKLRAASRRGAARVEGAGPRLSLDKTLGPETTE